MVVIQFQENKMPHIHEKIDFIHNLFFEWVEAYSLTESVQKFVPANFVYLPYRSNNKKIENLISSTQSS